MKRNNTIDLVRMIFAIFIIGIHTISNNWVKALLRTAVPGFFIISGYFVANKDSKEIKKTIKQVLILLLVSNFIHFCFDLYFSCKNSTTQDYLNMVIFNFEAWKKFFIFNTSQFSGHLWYICALLYCHIIYFICTFKKKQNNYILVTISIILFFMASFLCEIRPLLFGKTVKMVTYRNFLFLGLPYYIMGIVIRRADITLKNRKSVILIILSIILLYLEAYYLKKIRHSTFKEFYISTIFLTIGILIFAVSNPKLLKDNNYLVKIGRNYSLYMYIFHLLIIKIINNVCSKISIELNQYILFVLTVGFSIVVSAILRIVIDKISQKKNVILYKYNKIKKC